jgi:uncharacterized protein
MSEGLSYLLLFGAGLVAGALNVIAGGGSFLTLPALIFLGLSPTAANGTNRIGILVQNVGAVWGFNRHRVVPWAWVLWASIPATAGAGLGTWLALVVGDESFQRILAVLMVVVSLWSLADPVERWRRFRRGGPARTIDPAADVPLPAGWRLALFVAGFFLVGIYGGFVQAGAGFFILAVTSLAGLDLVRGNGLKAFAILVFTVLSLAIFAAQGEVEWLPGTLLAAGTLAGGMVGVRLTVLKGHRWVQGVVTGAIVVFAVLLWLDTR